MLIVLIGMRDEAGETGVNERRGAEEKVSMHAYAYLQAANLDPFSMCVHI